MKSRKTAAFLALFFGWAGVHRFYLGQPGFGVLYFLSLIFGFSFLRLPLSFVLGWIDAIVFFFQSDEEFDKKYNRKAVRRNPSHMARRKGPVSSRIEAQQQRKILSSKRNPFKLSGEKKLESFDLKGSIDDLNRSLEINENDADVHYMLAKAYSLDENVEKTYHHLSQAVATGFPDIAKFLTDDELAFIRIDKNWKNFVDMGYRRVPTSTPISGKVQEEKEEVKDDKLLAQLNRLAELRKQGLITDEDFEMEKKRILR